MDNRGKSEIENVNDDHINYNSTNMSLDWRFGGMELVSTSKKMDSSCTSASFCPPIWDHPSNLPNVALCDLIAENNASTSNPIGIRKGAERETDMGMFFPQNMSQIPTDSGFIETAARFSCFGDMMNNFGFLPLEKEVFAGIGLTSNSLKDELNMVEDSKDVSLSAEHESFVRSNDEAKQGARKSDNESDEAELSGGGGQEEPSVLEGGDGEPSSTNGLGSKKRKRIFKDPELDQVKGGAPQPPDEATNDDTKIQEKGDQKAASISDKPIVKNGKNGSQASDAQKGEYIHIRARRGQATNSHSLAERVRREKISERMKFLQDLVPGCSKVTGKAVMLDEIINYVQSLQRQVEFLSMKLATVNPRLDFNIDGLLAKDQILQSRADPSSTMGFSPDMTIPFSMLHPSQPGMIQTGLTNMVNSSEGLQRTINSQSMAMSGGYKGPTPQVPNSWEDELNNVVQMGFNSSAPLDGRDLSGSLPPGHTKVEL